MMFDNTPPESPSMWVTLRNHLPVILMVVGVVGLFISLHTAAYTVAGLAAGHLALGIGLFMVRALRGRNGADK